MRVRPKLLWTIVATGLCLALVSAAILRFSGAEPRVLMSRAEADRGVARAAVLIDRKDYAAARTLLDSTLAAHPDHGMARIYLGQLLREQGDLTAALAEWRRVSDHPQTIEGTARFLEGTVLLEQHRARDAERMLQLSAGLHPAYLQPRERLLDLHVLQRRRAEILDDLDAISRFRELTLPELVLSVLAGEPIIPPETALARLRQFIAADPEDLESRIALARYDLDRQRQPDIETVLRGTSRPAVEDVRVRALRGEALLRRERLDDARQVLGPWPPPPDSHELLWRSFGLYWTAAGEWRAAAESFARVAGANPYDLKAEYQLGSALHRLGLDEAAQRHLQRAERLDRLQRNVQMLARGDRGRPARFAEVIAEVGTLAEELGRAHDALAWFRQALLVDPRNQVALAGYRALQQQPAIVNAAPSAPDFGELPANGGEAHRAPSHSGSTASVQERPVSDIRLHDAHAQAGIDFRYFTGETGYKYLLETVGGGVGVLDYDSDGWPDLYFPQGCRLPFNPDDSTHTDRLYRNRGDGRFESVAEAAGVAENRYGQGCAAGDYNGDGFPDLFVANYGRNTLYRGNGDGTFSDVTLAAGLAAEQMSSSLALADLDRDGHLDLYVATYVESLKVCADQDGRISTCDPQNFEGEQDRLYWNAGDGSFIDVSDASGIVAPYGKGLGVVAADLDDDGWTDLYVANDGTPNFLFRNLGAESRPLAEQVDSSPLRFREDALAAGCALNGDGRSEAGMGIACADLDEDGLLDLYVTNFYQEQNTLYRNLGGGLFEDATRSAGLREPALPLLGFGTQAADLDLDGDPELFVANGHIDDFRARGEPWKMRPQLFLNLGRGRFQETSLAGAGPHPSPAAPGDDFTGDYFTGEYLGRGVARLDWNRDGRPDLVVVHHDRPAALLTNHTRPAGNNLCLALRGTRSNRDAIGARVTVTAAGRTSVHELCGGDGYMASNEQRLLIGLGSAERAESVSVRWPGGEEQLWSDLPSRASLLLIEGKRQPLPARAVLRENLAEWPASR